MLSIVAVTLVLGGLIFFHEMGHFLVARLFGVGVRTFSLGFGRRLVGFTSGRTDYRLSLIPLGGYVSLAGESPDEDDSADFPAGELFSGRPAWQRICVVAAGPIFNFLLAWLLAWFLFLSQGQSGLAPSVGEVVENGPAREAGLQPGDRIVAVNGRSVRFWEELREAIQSGGGSPLTLALERSGERMELTVTPRMEVGRNLFGEEIRVPMVGIRAGREVVTLDLGFFESGAAAARQTWDVVVLTIQGFVKLVERILPLETIGGPIMIAQMVSQQAQQGLAEVLALTAVLSINLGLINLLPIPVLDGGHILYFTLEMILGRPVNERARQIATRIGLAALLGLMLLALYNDLARILRHPPL